MNAMFLIINMWIAAVGHTPSKEVIIQHQSHSLSSPGKLLFEQHCSNCHGLDGTKGKFGAPNLQASVLTDEQYLRIIQKGKGVMPSWEKRLTNQQIADIVIYIKTLRR